MLAKVCPVLKHPNHLLIARNFDLLRTVTTTATGINNQGDVTGALIAMTGQPTKHMLLCAHFPIETVSGDHMKKLRDHKSRRIADLSRRTSLAESGFRSRLNECMAICHRLRAELPNDMLRQVSYACTIRFAKPERNPNGMLATRKYGRRGTEDEAAVQARLTASEANCSRRTTYERPEVRDTHRRGCI